MNCQYCGCQMDSADQFCPGCGKTRPVQVEEGKPIELMQSWEPVVTSAPVAQPAAPAPEFVPTNAPIPEPSPKPVDTRPIGVTTRVPMAPPRPSAPPPKASGLNKTLVLIVIGVCVLVVVVPLVLAIVIPSLLRGARRAASDETAAVAGLHSINTAETIYADRNPRIGFTCDLKALQSTGSVEPQLASGRKGGYVFELTSCLASSSGMVQLYQATATPTESAGKRVYCSDQSGVVRYDNSGSTSDCLTSGTPVD